MQRIPITPLGKEQLEQELNNLVKVKRPNIIKAIDEARAHGDLKENAEYHAAKDQQSFIEGRIQDINSKLAVAQVIDVTNISPSDRVIFGSTMLLVNTANNEQCTYKIVGEDEANIENSTISVNSPIAKQLIAKSIGDTVAVQTPAGETKYKILDVKYI
jgi:transcription elongation factor GreA